MLNILIVEDNSVMQKTIKIQVTAAFKLLGKVDINFLFATSCQEALEQVEAVADFYMIVMDGHLRGNSDGAETYIKLCKKYPNLEEITVGCSSSYATLDAWNAQIKLKYESENIRAEEKPDVLPIMQYCLAKPASHLEMQKLVDSFESRTEAVSGLLQM